MLALSVLTGGLRRLCRLARCLGARRAILALGVLTSGLCRLRHLARCLGTHGVQLNAQLSAMLALSVLTGGLRRLARCLGARRV